MGYANRIKKEQKVVLVGVLALLLVFGFFKVNAAERGIGVTPSKIRVQKAESWPHTEKVLVTNFSSDAEWIEVTVAKDAPYDISAQPARFALYAKERKVILLTMAEPQRQEESGKIRIVAKRVSPEGLATGTGLEIPYAVANENRIAAEQRQSVLLAAADFVFGSAMQWVWLGIFIGVLLFAIHRLSLYFAKFL
ncbi:MAG: hypothetical protein HYW95_01680 [Candidatus Wildermuthbacteria bacterium]|nr:hypothetical protein [Candidatus Wildermuthbacteria bacterium]